jgi:hypothetical protein
MTVYSPFLGCPQAVSQAIADVEKMEREEQAKRKALLEAKSCLSTKEADEIQTAPEDILEGVKMLVAVPATDETCALEPHAVVGMIEVPAPGPSASDLDIIIVDSSNLGRQEEVPPVTECQMAEIVLGGKNDDGSEQAISSEAALSAGGQDTLQDSGEKVAIEDESQDGPTENKQDDPAGTHGHDSADVSETVIQEDVVDKGLGMDEASRIEIVAIEIPASKAEEKECSKKDKTEELNKEKEQSIKEDDELVVENYDKPGTPAVDRVANAGEWKDSLDKCAATKDMMSAEDSEEQSLAKDEVRREAVKGDVGKEVAEVSLEDEVEENIEKETAAGSEPASEQREQEEEDLATAEPHSGSAKQSKEGLNKEAKQRDTEGKESMMRVHDAADIREATEDDDSRAESSEDEKKTDKKAWSAGHGEEAILENARYCNI